MGNGQSIEIPERICYLFGCPNILMTYNTQTDEFKKKEIEPNILKNMACVLIDECNVYLSGGISQNYSEVSNKVYRYNIEENIFRCLPDMLKPRYTHQLLFFKNKLYALGGRSYGEGNDGILNDCECYEFGKWQSIASMNVKRATFFSIIFRDKIYVFGGYTGVRKRSRKIEVYDNGVWNILNFKLQYGVEQGVLYQRNQEILILGGQSENGVIATHLVVDLIQEKSYLATSINQRPRVLQKGTQIEQYTIQFGDCNTIEKGKIDNLEQKEIKNMEDLREYSFADYTFELGVIRKTQNQFIIIQQEEMIYKINKKYFNDEQNLTKQQKFKQYIQEIKINNNQFSGIVILEDNSIIIFGGVNKQMNKISQDTYQITQNQINTLNKMNQGRYAFSYTLMDNYIYIGGGRYYGDDEKGILDSCERFDIKNNKWEIICNLNEKRCSSFMMHHNNKILIAGGFNTHKTRLNSIEIYDPQYNRWDMLGITLQNNIEGCAFNFKSYNNVLEFITFGGRSSFDLDQVITYKIDFDQPIDHQIGQFLLLDNLKQQGSLLQIITINNQIFIIGQIITVYDKNFTRIENQILQDLLIELKIQNIGRYKIID